MDMWLAEVHQVGGGWSTYLVGGCRGIRSARNCIAYCSIWSGVVERSILLYICMVQCFRALSYGRHAFFA